MPIIGLADENMRREARVPGRIVRIGTINKGKREEFGKDVKLVDLPYFRFTPSNGDERLTAAFAKAYGNEPTEFDDVRIPVGAAGNFSIYSCSWYVANKHTKQGSTFLARSDGRHIKQARRESDGRKVEFFYDGEMPHDDYTKPDKSGKPGFVYSGKVYPWQATFAIDLIFPKFNRMVFEDNLIGFGAITLRTTSLNDITSLTKEYESIIEELAAPFINPMTGNEEQVKKFLPLRNFPIRLYRQEETVGTPDYRDNADPSSRLVSKRSLLHWQVSPSFSASIQQAIDARTAALIDAAAKQSFLTDGRKPLAQLEAELFPDSEPPQLEETAGIADYDGPDWESLSEPIDGDYDEQEQEGEAEDYDWKEAALNATTVDGFAAAYYQLSKQSGVFDDATAVKKAFRYFFGSKVDENHTSGYIKALDIYVNTIADGGKVKEAKEKAAAVFSDFIEPVPF